MSLTTSEIAILAAPVATTCAALIVGAAVYVSVMRRRRKLPTRASDVLVDDGSAEAPGKTVLFRVRRDPLTGQIVGRLSNREKLGLSILLDETEAERAKPAE